MGAEVWHDHGAESGMTNNIVLIDDRSQYFIRESTYRRRGFMDEVQRTFLSFDEYVGLLFSGVPGEYIIRGL